MKIKMPSATIPESKANYMKLLGEYGAPTESPELYWLWSGIYTISAVLRRRVWMKFMTKPVYPCLYVCLVGEPGDRKEPPLRFARDRLTELGITFACDVNSRRSFCDELAAIQEQNYHRNGNQKLQPHAEITILSEELSQLLGIDLENMIDTLTALWDCQTLYRYNTSKSGHAYLHNVGISFIAATQPEWIVNNLPPGSVGTGWTSRVIFVPNSEEKSWNAFPELNESLILPMQEELRRISKLRGQYRLSKQAKALIKDWYEVELRSLYKQASDKRTIYFMKRMQENVFRVAMCLEAAHSNEMVITELWAEQAIDFLMSMMEGAAEAFSGSGKAKDASQLQTLYLQIREAGKVSFSDLVDWNRGDITDVDEMKKLLKVLEASKFIEIIGSGSGIAGVRWLNKKSKRERK